jgi:hypothetical protein
MKLIKNAKGKTILKLSKSDWLKIGEQKRWFKVAATLPAKIKSQINKEIHGIAQGYHDSIPLKAIFDAMAKHDISAMDDDGTPWSGMLIGGAECGSDETKNQIASFDLAFSREGSFEPIGNAGLMLSWCKMSSGKYEIVCYMA